MQYVLKTSKYTTECLKQLQKSLPYTRNVIARLAVGLSLRIPEPVNPVSLDTTGGFEIPRNVLTGEHDFIYKSLIAQHCKREITDEEYFPGLFQAHLERGIRILMNEYKHAGNYEKLIRNLLQ